jgi:small subunit ribosomal protein S14
MRLLSKNYLIRKDKGKRDKFFKAESRKLVYRAVFTNRLLPSRVRLFAFRKLAYISKHSSIGQLRNRCILTGRGRGVFRFFKLSRFQFKKFANLGYLTGVERTGW